MQQPTVMSGLNELRQDEARRGAASHFARGWRGPAFNSFAFIKQAANLRMMTQRGWHNGTRRALIPSATLVHARPPSKPPLRRARTAANRSVYGDVEAQARRRLTSSPASIGWPRPRWTVSRIHTLAELAPTCSLCCVFFCSHTAETIPIPGPSCVCLVCFLAALDSHRSSCCRARRGCALAARL